MGSSYDIKQTEKLEKIEQHMQAMSDNTSSTLTEIKDLVASTKRQGRHALWTTGLAVLTFIASLASIYYQATTH